MRIFFLRMNHKNQFIAIVTDLFFDEIIRKKKKYFGTSYLFLFTIFRNRILQKYPIPILT